MSKIKKIYEFGASWCGPCKAYGPVFKRVSDMEEFTGIEFKQIDVDSDEGEELSEKFQVRNVPTTLIIGDNEELKFRLVGNIPENDLVKLIRDNNKEDEEVTE